MAFMTGLVLGLLATGRTYSQPVASDAPCCQVGTQDSNEVEAAITHLQEKAATLRSYQARVDYVVRQPLLDSQQRRKGILHYLKSDQRSHLRIDFRTLQQDEEPERKYAEQFLFDGVWLWHVDYQIERVERRQLTEPNQPIDALALASRHVPVLGFSKIRDLRKQFDVTLVTDPQGGETTFRHLHLTVKPDSVYRDDYVTIDFWIDQKVGLPTKVVAVTTEEDVHEIRLIAPKVNARMEPKTFQIDLPKGFDVQVIPLDRKRREN
jgi:outer membrane lipoprotein-sorting protein